MKARSPRLSATLFIGDVSSDDSERVPTVEAIPLGVTRDWSETGVFVQTPARPPLGSMIKLVCVWGDDAVRCKARVARHCADGIGLNFVAPELAFVHAVRSILKEAERDA